VKTTLLAITALTAIALLPSSASAATCSSYRTQAEAQRAADTRDSDGDGIYCESLPCPCLKPGTGSPPPPPPPPASAPKASCSRPATVRRKRPNTAPDDPAATLRGRLRHVTTPDLARLYEPVRPVRALAAGSKGTWRNDETTVRLAFVTRMVSRPA